MSNTISGYEAQVRLEDALMKAEREAAQGESEVKDERSIPEMLSDIDQKLEKISSHLDAIVDRLEKTEKKPSVLKG